MKRDARRLRVDRSDRDRVAAVIGVFLSVASAILTLVGLPWWVATAVCGAALWFGSAAYRRVDLLAPTTLGTALVAAVAVTLMARGAWEVLRPDPYAGEFVVVGDSPVVVGSLAPERDTEGSLNNNWETGDSVTVECVARDSEDPNRHWYRTRRKPKVFLPDSQLTPSRTEPPGEPPRC